MCLNEHNGKCIQLTIYRLLVHGAPYDRADTPDPPHLRHVGVAAVRASCRFRKGQLYRNNGQPPGAPPYKKPPYTSTRFASHLSDTLSQLYRTTSTTQYAAHIGSGSREFFADYHPRCRLLSQELGRASDQRP